MIKRLLKLVKPIVKWIGEVHMPFNKKKITGENYYLLRDKIQPGHIILSKQYGELSNLINPGKLKHAILYIGGQKIKYAIEAIGRGVVKRDLITVLLSKDEVVVLRPKKHSSSQIEAAIAEAETHIGDEYDYFFSLNNRAKYCSELIWEAYMRAAPEYKLRSKEIAGLTVVRPDDFLKDKEHWEVVYDSRKVA